MVELGPDGGALVVGEDVLVAADVFGEFAAQRDDLVVLPGLEHGGDGGGGLGVEPLRTLGLRRRGKALRAGGKDGQGDKCAGKGGKRLLHVFSPRRGHNTARGKMKMRFLRAPSRQGEVRGNILLRRLLVSHPSFRKEYAEPVTKDNHARIGKTN